MELSLSLRTAFYDALNGNITSNGQPVPIYDVFAIPEQPKYPYILLSSQTATQRNVQRCKVYDASLLVDIVTGSTDPIGREQSEEIAGQIEDIVIPSDFTDLIAPGGYVIGDTWREQDFEDTNKNDIYYIYRKLIRYNFIISKSN